MIRYFWLHVKFVYNYNRYNIRTRAQISNRIIHPPCSFVYKRHDGAVSWTRDAQTGSRLRACAQSIYRSVPARCQLIRRRSKYDLGETLWWFP